jgi:hypothetical protein
VHTERSAIDAGGAVVSAPSVWPRERFQGSCLAALIEGNSITVSSVLVRRSVLGDERFHPSVSTAADWDMWLRLAAKTDFGFVPSPLTEYRLHASNMSKDSERMRLDERRVLDRLLERETDPDLRRMAERVRRRVFRNLGHCAYERHDHAAALRAFLSAWGDLGWPEIRRLGVSTVPALVSKMGRSS